MSKHTNRLGIFSFFVAIICLTSKTFSISFIIGSIILFIVINQLKDWWVEGQPNEWVLVIKNGNMSRAGIGLKTLVFPSQSVVKFASKVQRVEFRAQNVTKQNQGVQIEGFAFWSVYRENDGPFRCYKYMQGGNPNANVKTMCQSSLRNQLANSTLMEVLRKRNLIRDSMKRDLQKQLASWGVWLQTVELTQVRICSKRLFEDLQADYRQNLSSKAATILLSNNESLSELKIQSNKKLSKAREQNQTKSMVITSNQKIKQSQQQAKSAQKLYEFDKRRISKSKQLKLAQINKDQQLSLKSIEYSAELQNLKKDFELEMFKQQVKNLENHNELTLQKYALDSAQRVFSRQYRTIQLHQFVGQQDGIAKLLPGLQATNIALQ